MKRVRERTVYRGSIILTNSHYVAVFACSNDLRVCEPGQLTIQQAISELLTITIETNVIVNSRTYHYDIP